MVEIDKLTGGLNKVEEGLWTAAKLNSIQNNIMIKMCWSDKAGVESIALLYGTLSNK